MFISRLPPLLCGVLVLFRLGAEPIDETKPLVDRYGQYLYEDWPGKVKSDADLLGASKAEEQKLRDFKTDPELYDRFGGIKAAPRGKSTGFFHVEKIEGRWWLITPEGNRFFLRGTAAASALTVPHYATPLRDPATGAVRKCFTELPDPAKAPDAYRFGGMVSFLHSNLQKKYGTDYEKTWNKRILERLRSWGFNGTGQWQFGCCMEIPYLDDMHLNKARRIGNFVDPWGDDFRDAVAREIQQAKEKRGFLKDDPWLLGYVFENENTWYPYAVELTLQQTGDVPAKRELIRFLGKRYGNGLGEMLGLPGANAETLCETAIRKHKIPGRDINDFITATARRYYQVIREELNKFDTNHMLWGTAPNLPMEPWVTGGEGVVDVALVHDYEILKENPPYAGFFAWSEKNDIPAAVMEFGFHADRHGYPPARSSCAVAGDREAGLAYQLYTEKLAARRNVIGFSIFCLYDQALTGRSWPDGENINWGIITQTDQPKYEMLQSVQAANQRVEAIHSGALRPVDFSQWKKIAGSFATGRLTRDMFRGSVTPGVSAGFWSPAYPTHKHDRLAMDAWEIPRPGWIECGTFDAGVGKSFRKFTCETYLAKDANPKNWNEWFQLESSPNNRTYTALPVVFTPIEGDQKFNAAQAVCSEIPRGTRFLRMRLNQRDYSRSNAIQIANWKMEK